MRTACPGFERASRSSAMPDARDRGRVGLRTRPVAPPSRPAGLARRREAPLFTGDPVAGEEPRQAAGAGLHAALPEQIAQLAQEDLRLLLTGFQDQGGLRLDAMRGVISARRLGRNAAVPPGPGRASGSPSPRRCRSARRLYDRRHRPRSPRSRGGAGRVIRRLPWRHSLADQRKRIRTAAAKPGCDSARWRTALGLDRAASPRRPSRIAPARDGSFQDPTGRSCGPPALASKEPRAAVRCRLLWAAFCAPSSARRSGMYGRSEGMAIRLPRSRHSNYRWGASRSARVLIEPGGAPSYPATFVSDGCTMVTLWRVAHPDEAVSFDRRSNVGLHHSRAEGGDRGHVRSCSSRCRSQSRRRGTGLKPFSLSDAVAGRLVDLWNARSEHARTSFKATDRMIEGRNASPSRARTCRADTSSRYTQLWSLFGHDARGSRHLCGPPITLQPKPKAVTFFLKAWQCKQLRHELNPQLALTDPSRSTKSARGRSAGNRELAPRSAEA